MLWGAELKPELGHNLVYPAGRPPGEIHRLHRGPTRHYDLAQRYSMTQSVNIVPVQVDSQFAFRLGDSAK